MVTLDYSQESGSSASEVRALAVLALTILFSIVHFAFYAPFTAYEIWTWMGGIQQQGRVTFFGGCDYAPTVPFHLPAGILFYGGIQARGLRNPGPEAALGVLLIFAGSGAAGLSAAILCLSLLRPTRPRLGRYWWRLWLFLGGWGWIIVPAEMSWVYQWTVVY